MPKTHINFKYWLNNGGVFGNYVLYLISTDRINSRIEQKEPGCSSKIGTLRFLFTRIGEGVWLCVRSLSLFRHLLKQKKIPSLHLRSPKKAFTTI